MEESNITEKTRPPNSTGYVQVSRHHAHLPQSPMPAWVPAVSVAIAMLIFLTASFYIRHRKVVKKRQILMDYFYVILQYGGLRRKRMVTALCNSNAISLYQLGRSFMISFDSNENSCPFYHEDTAFTKASSSGGGGNPYQHHRGTPKAKNKLRAPFRRVMSQIDDGANSVHDMLMKFKSKKKYGNATHSNSQGLAPPRGISLSSIHEDEYGYSARADYEASPRFRQRRNANSFDNSEHQLKASLSELLGDTDDHHLGPNNHNNMVYEHYLSRRPSTRKRSFYLPDNPSNDGEEEELRVISPTSGNLRVFQFGGGGNSFSVRQHSSHSSHSHRSGSSRQNSKNEPLILVHAASNDFSSSQESDEIIQGPYSNGVMVLRRVSRDYSSQDHGHGGDESPRPAYRRNKRASVSYVPSGNMNDYYHHCLHTSTHSINSKVEDDEFDTNDEKSFKFGSGFPWKKNNSPKTGSPQHVVSPPRNKRSRLSLGDIGVSNFNRRIEESLGSMHEQDSLSSCGRLSKDLSDERGAKPRGAWKRLKNVFAGIRWSQPSKQKQLTSVASEERMKQKNKRNTSNNSNKKWNKFFKNLKGFRSFPEEKSHSFQGEGPKASKSLPLGLDKHSLTIEDLEFHLAMSMDSQSTKQKKRNIKNPFSKGAADTSDGGNKGCPKGPSKTRSFPDNILFFQGHTKSTPFLYHLQSDPSGSSSFHQKPGGGSGGGRKSKKRYNTYDENLQTHCNVDFLCSPSHASFLSFAAQDSNARNYRRTSGSISPRMLSPVAKKRDRRYKSLSPLPEKQYSSSPRKGKNVRWYSHSERNSFSERGLLGFTAPPAHRNSFSFSTDNPDKGNSLGSIVLNNDCVLRRSCRDLSDTPLLNIKQTSQMILGDAAGFLPMGVVESRRNSNSEQNDKTGNNSSAGDKQIVDIVDAPLDVAEKEECDSEIKCDLSAESSVEQQPSLESTESDSQSKLHSLQITNSSTDSVYFDAFSIPGSPMTNLKPQPSEISSPTNHSCGSLALPLSSPSSDNLFPSLYLLPTPPAVDLPIHKPDNDSNSTTTIATTTATTIATTTTPPALCCAAADASSHHPPPPPSPPPPVQTTTAKTTTRDDQKYAPPPIYTIMHNPVCEASTSSSLQLPTHATHYHSTTTTTTPSPSHVVDIPFDTIYVDMETTTDYNNYNPCEETPLTTSSYMDGGECTTNVDDKEDSCDESDSLSALINDSETVSLTSGKHSKLEHQNSTTSDDIFMSKMTRLPRFGRRASNQSASLFLPS